MCTAEISADVTQPTVLAIIIDSTQDVSCNGGNDGEIYTTVTGGTGSYSYIWTNTAQTTDDITNLSINYWKGSRGPK